MNKQLQKFARDTIKKGLGQCGVEQQTLFKQMYAHDLNPLETFIDDIVDNMDESKLDWAMQQVQATLGKEEPTSDDSGCRYGPCPVCGQLALKRLFVGTEKP